MGKKTAPETGLPENDQKREDRNNASVSTTKDDNAIPPEVREILDDISPDARQLVARYITHDSRFLSVAEGKTDPELLKQQDNHQYDLSLKGLEATQIDRREEREHQLKQFKISSWLVVLIVVLLAGIAFAALFKDNTNFMKELFYSIAVFGGGFGLGSYVESRSKPKK